MRKLRQIVGHRGAFLLFLAILDILYGYSLFTVNFPLSGSYPLLSQESWAVAWTVVGAICLFSAFLRGKRDRIAFSVSAFLKTAWALRYAWLWHLGLPEAWLAVVVWLAFAATVLVIASWPEPVIIIDPPLPVIQEDIGGDR